MTYRTRIAFAAVVAALFVVALAGCAARQAGDTLEGATAQRLVSFGIDDLSAELPDEDFRPWADRALYIESHALAGDAVRHYADARIALALESRYGIERAGTREAADGVLRVFYTSLGTSRDTQGVFLPLGYVPGLDSDSRINILTLEQFHGLAEMYYFVGETGTEVRGEIIGARTRTDAIGLPIATIPLSDIEREGEKPGRAESRPP